jgi:polysaccharide pyruvyl transferase WcaK-like protein
VKVLITHAYSARNAGDGLLVRDSIRIAQDALGPQTHITILASHPATFRGVDATIIDSSLHWYGYRRSYLRVLMHINKFDRVIAVGGGYLRAGNCVETLKTALIHGPQLIAGARRGQGVTYLPQSIGPIRFGLLPLVSALLRRVDFVFLRDDRSVSELDLPNAVRVPDLAAASVTRRGQAPEVDDVPVLSVRKIKGAMPPLVQQLAERLSTFDVYVQSTSSGNDDRQVSACLNARNELASPDFLGDLGPRRVVVAVRLHAAIMALQAGHFVIHLAYERKGFGAYSDLGLGEYVHNVNNFSVDEVLTQVTNLTIHQAYRDRFVAAIGETEQSRHSALRECATHVQLGHERMPK